MNGATGCDKVLLVQAELDGELGPAEAAALAVHRADCPICQEAAEELTRARAMVRPSLYRPMPEDVRARVVALLNADPRGEAAEPSRVLEWLRRWWSAAAGFGIGAACATAMALLLIAPPQGQTLTDEVVASHIRALQPGHLEDVPSTDQHTVKPWFDGRIDFAPPVKNLVGEQFPLIGGRLDYLDNKPVAALVYQHDKHLIDLYAWPSPGNTQGPAATQRQGYNVVHWREGGMTLWAVSDLEADLLRQFADDWRRSP